MLNFSAISVFIMSVDYESTHLLIAHSRSHSRNLSSLIITSLTYVYKRHFGLTFQPTSVSIACWPNAAIFLILTSALGWQIETNREIRPYLMWHEYKYDFIEIIKLRNIVNTVYAVSILCDTKLKSPRNRRIGAKTIARRLPSWYIAPWNIVCRALPIN